MEGRPANFGPETGLIDDWLWDIDFFHESDRLLSFREMGIPERLEQIPPGDSLYERRLK
jgi:hypothetical protein